MKKFIWSLQFVIVATVLGFAPGMPVLADELPVAAVSASAHDGNVPANTIDNNLGTRWSALGDGQWIQFDLGSVKTVTDAQIAFHRGNARRARFALQASTDGTSWATVFDGQSSGTTLAQERFPFDPVSARYLRYLGHGNSANLWNSLTEVDIHGDGAAAAVAAYRWAHNASQFSNANRVAAPGLNDGNTTVDVNLSGGSPEAAAAYEAGGLVWNSVQTITQVQFVNGSWASTMDGGFCADLKLQTSMDGSTWANSNWSVAPAYAYDSPTVAGVTYAFSGPPITARAIRVSGRLRCTTNSSYWANIREITATLGDGGPDTTPPSPPTGLTATAVNAARVDLAWTASSDNVGVVKYQVFRDGGATPIAEPTGTTFSDTSVAANTVYSYTVKAADAAGNLSAESNTATVTTPPATDCAFPGLPPGDCNPWLPPAASGKTWRLSFNEEFNGSDYDRGKLTPCLDWNFGACNSATNGGREYYRASQIRVSNGTGKLVAEPVSPPVPGSGCQNGQCTYLSGVLTTARPQANNGSDYLFKFTYGYVEAKLKFPATQGFFTAFWMLPISPDNSFVFDTEIDILELLGHDPVTMWMHYHYNNRGSSFRVNGGIGDNGNCPNIDYSTDFHRLGLDWQPNHIAWYIDGVKCGEFTGNTSNIEDGPMYVILQLMVDNNWQRSWGKGLLDPTLTRQLEVDYIRVFQQQDVPTAGPWPNATNTGYRNAPGYPGSLTPFTGNIQSGQTYRFFTFSPGFSVENVNDVTFYGCRFTGDDASAFANVIVRGSNNITFDHSSFEPSSVTAPPVGYTQSSQFGIWQHPTNPGKLTVDHSDFWGFGNGIQFFPSGDPAKPFTVRNSWFHDARDDGGVDHTDGILNGDSVGSYIVIDHNTIVSRGNTNALALQDTADHNVTVTNNYFSGFGTTVRLGGAGNTNFVFTDNTFGTDIRPEWGWHRTVYGWAGGNGNIWRRNKWYVAPGSSYTPVSDHGKYWLPDGSVSDTDYAGP